MVLPWLALAAMAAPVVAGGVSRALTWDDDEEQRQALQDQVDAFQNIQAPQTMQTPDFAQYYDPMLRYRGPELEQVARYQQEGALPPLQSQMQQLSVSPEYQQAQMAALRQMQALGEGGLTDMDEASLQRISDMAGQRSRAGREAITQSMRQKGIEGSGLDLAGQMAAEEAATQRMSQEGFDVAGMAQQRALQSLMQSGQLGGQMRGQEFGEQEAIARARDDISRFNLANQANIRQRNVDRVNQEQDLMQSLSNQNIGFQRQDAAARAEASRNMQLEKNRLAQQDYQNRFGQAQSDFANQMRRQEGIYGVNRDLQNMQAAQTQQKRDMIMDFGRGGSQALAAYGMYGKK